MNTLVGCDPELFLSDGEGAPFSAVGLIGGTKREPRKIREDGCAVQEDNVAVEFCIPPCNEVSAFIETINFNLEYIANYVKDKGLSLRITASEDFSIEQLESQQAKLFGCEPDYNAWTMRTNPRPKSESKLLRSAGDHVHVSADSHPFLVARAMDVFLGVPSVLLDEDTRRRELYGKAGACRPKPYGVEYRTLSNFWLKSDELKAWVFNQAQKAVTFAAEKEDWLEDKMQVIQDCINMSDKDTARGLMVEYGV